MDVTAGQSTPRPEAPAAPPPAHRPDLPWWLARSPLDLPSPDLWVSIALVSASNLAMRSALARSSPAYLREVELEVPGGGWDSRLYGELVLWQLWEGGRGEGGPGGRGGVRAEGRVMLPARHPRVAGHIDQGQLAGDHLHHGYIPPHTTPASPPGSLHGRWSPSPSPRPSWPPWSRTAPRWG